MLKVLINRTLSKKVCECNANAMRTHNERIKNKTMNKTDKNKASQESINTLISELIFIANNKAFKNDLNKHILSVLKDNKNALKSIINNK